MTWRLSQFRAGDLVEVRSREEILATLDQEGCLDQMPFMPEMLAYCGRRFRVGAVAHKTCETAHKTHKGRRLQATVHLEGVRCDGSAHGGCQADCNLFWKDRWLKPVDDVGSGSKVQENDSVKLATAGCTEGQLLASARLASTGEGDEPRYSCQATRLYEATESLSAFDVRQYLYDVVTRNHSPGRVLRVLWLAALRKLVLRMPIGYRFFNAFSNWWHRLLTGRPAPSCHGQIKSGHSTPTGRLDLKPGEYVRIKSKEEIEKTIDEKGRNRGLSFDLEEMAPYCNRVFRVRRSVAKILDEVTGEMLHMKQPCIILEDVVCRAEYASCRLNCPRAFPAYWREIWLERASGDGHQSSGDISVRSAYLLSQHRQRIVASNRHNSSRGSGVELELAFQGRPIPGEQ